MTVPKVLVPEQAAHAESVIRDQLADHLPDTEIDPVIADTREDSLREIADAEVVLTWGLDEEQLERADRLAWVQALSAGVDSYPLEEFADRAVALTNASGVHAEPIGEQVLGYLLVFERRIHEGIRQQHAGEWESYSSGELADRTLGVVGVGAIGTRVAEFGSMMGMEVLGTKRNPSESIAAVDELYGSDGLDVLLDRSDYLVIACPLTDETEGLIGRAELDTLGEEAVLVNIARGEIVDQDALIDALEQEVIRGAGLDAFEEEPLPEDSPLRDRWNVVMTPHVSGSTPHYYDRAIAIFAENYRAFTTETDPSFRNQVL